MTAASMRSEGPFSGTTSAPVLVFGSDTSAFLGTVRSLGRKGIPVHAAGCKAHMPACSSRYIVEAHDLPAYEGNGEAWLNQVRALLRHHDFAMLVPTSDASLGQLAAHREILGAHRVAAPSDEALELFSDKSATRSTAKTLGIPVPEGQLIVGDVRAEDLINDLGLPLIVKSSRSYALGNRTQKSPVTIVDSPPLLERAMADAQEPLVEQYIPGFCRGVSVLAVDGQVLQAFQHRRLRQEHATGPSSWRASEELDPSLLEAARMLIDHADYTGVAMIEFRCPEDGDGFALLEVNPRFWGSMQLAMDAGADYPAALHSFMTDGLKPPERLRFHSGLQKRSVWGEFDALSQAWDKAEGMRGKIQVLREIAAFLISLARKEGFDSYAADDPSPFETERAQVLGRFKTRLTGVEAVGGRVADRAS